MNLYQVIEGFVVRMEGLEPPCRKALDPKSSASTNFATSAMLMLEKRYNLSTHALDCLVRLPAGRQVYQFRHIRKLEGKGSLFFEKSQCNRPR